MTLYHVGLILVPLMIMVNVSINNRSVFSWACIGVVLASSIVGLSIQ